jgi:hypothetical protein
MNWPNAAVIGRKCDGLDWNSYRVCTIAAVYVIGTYLLSSGTRSTEDKTIATTKPYHSSLFSFFFSEIFQQPPRFLLLWFGSAFTSAAVLRKGADVSLIILRH